MESQKVKFLIGGTPYKKPTNVNAYHSSWDIVNDKRFFFRGLSLSSDNRTLLEGSTSNDYWYFTVGYNVSWTGLTESPSWLHAARGISAPKTLLLVHVPRKLLYL